MFIILKGLKNDFIICLQVIYILNKINVIIDTETYFEN